MFSFFSFPANNKKSKYHSEPEESSAKKRLKLNAPDSSSCKELEEPEESSVRKKLKLDAQDSSSKWREEPKESQAKKKLNLDAQDSSFKARGDTGSEQIITFVPNKVLLIYGMLRISG